jgi:hypothetical protein
MEQLLPTVEVTITNDASDGDALAGATAVEIKIDAGPLSGCSKAGTRQG